MGGRASHGGGNTAESETYPGRNPDGTFTKGSELARELGAQGGHASHGSERHWISSDRNPDGTFTKSSEAAREVGIKGGHASHGGGNTEETETLSGRNPDGTFTKGSEAAKEAGIKENKPIMDWVIAINDRMGNKLMSNSKLTKLAL